MKHNGFKPKRKKAPTDRRFIIAIIVITSALSFSLGYFVGGAGEKVKQPQHEIIAVTKFETAQQAQELPAAAKEPQTENTVKDLSLSGADVSKPQIAEEKAPSQQSIPPQPAALKGTIEPKIETDTSNQSDIEYTVQAGAFKSLKEAETLKHKLEAKGYKAYIKKYVKSKNPKLYKVRTGEFASKEEAAAFALKLKNEGLKAFVTPKNEQ